MSANYAAMEALVDELVRCGVKEVCLSPGNRSAPLAFALARHPGMRVWTHVDERSGGFFGLGRARASRRPVALACTSGTAAANFLPAVVEAHHGRVPLVVLTADRPPELRDRSAPQTIDQVRLYGTHARWAFDLGVPGDASLDVSTIRSIADRAVAEAVAGGVAHVNLPMREPLDPTDEEPGPFSVTLEDRPTTTFHAPTLEASAAATEEALAELRRAQRPLLYCGPMDPEEGGFVDAVRTLATRWGAPVLAEPISNLRSADLGGVLVTTHEALLRDPTFAAEARPDAILRLGGPPTSRTVATWLDRCDARQLVVSESDLWPDPGARASHLVRARVGSTCRRWADALSPSTTGGAWRSMWASAEEGAAKAIENAIAEADDAFFEAHVVRAIGDVVSSDGCVYVASSLAVRVLDWFWPRSAPAVRMLANRGANGIDGFVSSVLGAAAQGTRTVGLCGDLALFHDVGGLASARRLGLDATFVVSNNGGGGIFDFLPTARGPAGFREHYEELFATPLGLDLGPVVQAMGGWHAKVERLSELRPAIEEAHGRPGLSVVDVAVDRQASQRGHARVWDAVKGRAEC